MDRRGLKLRRALFRAALPVLRRMPLAAATLQMSRIGRAEYAAFPQLRARFQAAAERGNAYFGCPWNVAALARELAGNHVRWWLRDQLLDGLPDRSVVARFAVSGREHLDLAQAEGRGVLLLGSHFGDPWLPAHWLVRAGFAVRWYTERPKHVSRYIEGWFGSDGPLGQRQLFISRKADRAEAARSILHAVRVLRAGLILGAACDVRWIGQQTAPARFLGRTYHFSSTWVALAGMTGAPVVPIFCRTDDHARYQLEFLPGYHVPSGIQGPDEAAPWVQAALRALEERVRLHPGSSNDYFFWNDRELARTSA
ncbi:MAG: lysophospholipid acyltransferase family protein [Isosphaeraceae bacterium]